MASGFAAAASGAYAQAVQPGEWSMTSKILSIQGQRLPPAMAQAMMEPKTNQACVTPEQAAKGFAGTMHNADDCSSQRMTINGGMLDAEVICKDVTGTRSMHLHGPYSSNAYNLTAQISTAGARPTNMTISMVAKRLGACH